MKYFLTTLALNIVPRIPAIATGVFISILTSLSNNLIVLIQIFPNQRKNILLSLFSSFVIFDTSMVVNSDMRTKEESEIEISANESSRVLILSCLES
ncbi:MAG: hypothetical protein QMD92_04825 [bacterium]|nr:hypothetical protein [bacterium]